MIGHSNEATSGNNKEPDSDDSSYLSFPSEQSFEIENPQPGTSIQPHVPPTSSNNNIKQENTFPQNLLWMFLFLGHIIIVAFFGLKTGIRQMQLKHRGNGMESVDIHLQTAKYWLLYGTAQILSFFLSIFLFFLLKWKTKFILKILVHSLSTYLTVVSVSIFYQEKYFWGCVFLFAALFQFFFVISIMERLYFTILMIRKSFTILYKFPFIFLMMLSWMVLLFCWLTIWSLSISSIIVMGEEGDLKWWYILILCISLFWTSAVVVNSAHLCTSFIVTNYFFQLEYNDEKTSRQLNFYSMMYSLLHSFGSICLGSLLCYPIRILRTIIRSIRSKTGSNECLFCCVNFVFILVETLVRHFNKYGYVMLAMNVRGFNVSSLNAWELLQSTGVEVLVAYDLTSAVLLMGCFLAALVAGTLVTVFNWFMYHKHIVVIGIGSVIISSVMISVPMAAIEGTVSSLYIVFAKNPSLISKFNSNFYLQMTKMFNRRLQHRSGKKLSRDMSSGEFVMQFP